MAGTKTQNLLIISHVQHYFWQGKFWAYGPYTREIDIWADIFPAVIIASPCLSGQPTGECLPFTRSNISVNPITVKGGGNSISAKFLLLLNLPLVVWKLTHCMLRAWAIHVRLPGNLGAIGALLAPLFSKRITAKYAGTWPDYPGEPFSYRFQKSILKSAWFNGPVTVYGHWQKQPKHIIPFFTSILTTEQIQIAKEAAIGKKLHSPARILFVGRTDKGKNAHVLIGAIALLKGKGIPTETRIIGGGAETENLINQVKILDLDKEIIFTGSIPFSKVIENYKWGDILVLVSENSEGWPKAIAEGMAFGLVCIGSVRGLIPQMLAEGRGIVLPTISPTHLENVLEKILVAPDEFVEISKRAAAWSQEYSLDGLRTEIRSLLIQKWQLQPEEFFALQTEEKME